MQPRLYAVLADIHANFQALKAVEADALHMRRVLNAESVCFVVLGDVVDYGPQPNQCMEWVERHAEIVIQGNHDVDVAESLYQEPKTIAPVYWPITTWTRWVLKDEYKEAIVAGKGCRWRSDLCHGVLPPALDSFMLFHSSLTGGHQARIDDAQSAWRNIQRLRDGAMYGLFGHTHIQGYFVDDPLRKQNHKDQTTTMYVVCPEDTVQKKINGSSFWEVALLEPDGDSEVERVGRTPWTEMPAHRALFNPGGLGQPRPSGPTSVSAPPDNRASYMLLQSNGRLQFQFRRVPYDFEETIRLLREEVTWPPNTRTLGSDILKEAAGENPIPREAWNSMMKNYRESLWSAPQTLPALVEGKLIPQLR